MKSKFFGLNAKLALAVLAAGTMFTSCYDSENGDVSEPYVAPDPVYMVSGTITDALTNKPITSATVSVTDAKGNVTFNSGTYTVQVASAGTKTVTVSAAGYDEVERQITIAELSKGEASTTVVNIALTPAGAINVNDVQVECDYSQVNSVDTVLTRSEYEGLDLTADMDGNSATFERVFKVEVGSVTDPEIEEAFEGAPAGLVDYAKSWLGAIVGQFGELTMIEVPYTISIPPYQCVESVTVTYAVVKSKYDFTYAGQTYSVIVKGVRTYTFSTQFLPNHGFSHSQGHGHGHSDSINAGGGILTGDM